MRHFSRTFNLICLVVGILVAVSVGQYTLHSAPEQPIRLGIIGVDTLHAEVFTRILNDPNDPEHVPGARVVAAFKGGSPDIQYSREVVDTYAAELRDKYKVEFVPDIPTLCTKVDAVLLESVDGRTHLRQIKPVIAAGKPVFIDKPLAASYEDAKEIARLADEKRVPWFTSSGLRFWQETRRIELAAKGMQIVGCDVYGPCLLEPHNPDLTWYGIHEVAILYTFMGTGCVSVVQEHTQGTDVVVGKWNDGRLGVIRGIRNGKADWGMNVFGASEIFRSQAVPYSYQPLVAEIVKFFQTHAAPVKEAESLEMFAFMEAANLSVQRGGAEVELREVEK